MKKVLFTLAFSTLFLGAQATEVETTPVKKDHQTENVSESETEGASQQVRFYNKCSSSVDFYVKSSGGTTKYSVSANNSKNVGVSVGATILDSSRNKIVEVTSSTSKVIVCD